MAREEAVVDNALGTSPGANPAAGPADLFIGIAGLTRADEVHSRVEALLGRLAAGPSIPRIVVAYPDADGAAPDGVPVRFLGYDLPPAEGLASPWAAASVANRALVKLAVETDARVCVLLNPDLSGLDSGVLEQLTFPILEKQVDLAVPVYPQTRYDGLLNVSILAPLTRALYGRRVRFPLASDLALSPAMAARLAHPAVSKAAHAGATPVTWPASVAAGLDMQVAQVYLSITHPPRTEGLDLSAVIAQLVGSIFLDMDQNASLWQRVRGSQATATWGMPTQAPEDSQQVDTRPMVQSFLLGSRSLQEVWGLILPPVTLLELKRLTLLPAESFRMPDELWVRIVYDFALAFRLRTISRTHLLGALTPLYLGWVASYIREMSTVPPPAAEQRLEQLAKAYEDGKPYLVRRWRWPDRFNP
jgi:hypothetical protein